jgi:hypothetical protein
VYDLSRKCAGLGPPPLLRTFPRRVAAARSESAFATTSTQPQYVGTKKSLVSDFFIPNVAGLGVEPSLRDYEPHVHRTLSRASA